MVLALAAVAGPAAGQHDGPLEGGLLGRATLFDPSIRRPHSAVGVGARVGAYVGSQWLIEADFSTSPGGALDYEALHFRVNLLELFQPGGQLVLGLGYVRNHYGGALAGSDDGLAGVFGLRFGLTPAIFARIDGTLDYMPSPVNRAGDNWNFAIQLGGGYRLSRK